MASTSSAAAAAPEEAQPSPRLLLSPQRQHRHGVILLACGCFNPPTFMHLRMFELARDHLHRRTNYRVIEGVISVVNDAYQKKDLVSAEHRLKMVRLALENSKWIRVDDWESQQTQWCPTVKVLRHIRSIARQRQLLQLPEKLKPHSPSVDDEIGPNVGPSPLKKSKMDGPSAQSSTESSGVGSIVSDHHQQPSQPSIVPKSASIDVATIGTAAATLSTEEEAPVRVMLLCGSDLLQSFEVPNLWAPEDMEEIVRDFGIVVVTRSGYDPRKVVYESDLLTRYENNIHYVTEWIANDISSTKIRRALKRAESVRYLVADRVLDYIYQQKLYGCSRRYLDILSSPSSLLETVRETAPLEHEEPHCSYHPQYRRLDRKSITDDSDYDNLAPCPCPLTASASAPNAATSHMLRSPHFYGASPSAFIRPIDYRRPMDKTLSLDVPSSESQSATAKPTKFPTDLDAALHVVKTGTTPATMGDGLRNTIRPTVMKSALKSPPGPPGARQRAVSYHSDLSRSTTSRSQPLPSSRTIDMGESNVILEEQAQGPSMPFGSVSAHQRSLSSDLQPGSETGPQTRNGSRTPVTDIVSTGPTATVPKNGAQGNGAGTDTEEVAWHYNPELTKSLPNLRARQTPPRHVRIMDKGVCFSPEDREEGVERASDGDESASSLANSLVVKVKQLRLTMSPETTV